MFVAVTVALEIALYGVFQLRRASKLLVVYVVCWLQIVDLMSACALLGLVRRKHIDCDSDECTVTAEFG